jgi:hypothetical protein
MKHDDIVLRLDNKELNRVLSPIFGQIGCWSQFNHICDKKIKDWTIREMLVYFKNFIISESDSNISLEEFKKNVTEEKMRLKIERIQKV